MPFLSVLAYLWHEFFYVALPFTGLVLLGWFARSYVAARRSREMLARLTEVVPPAPTPSLEPDYRVGAFDSHSLPM